MCIKPIYCSQVIYMHTHTHTHTYIYIYILIVLMLQVDESDGQAYIVIKVYDYRTNRIIKTWRTTVNTLLLLHRINTRYTLRLT